LESGTRDLGIGIGIGDPLPALHLLSTKAKVGTTPHEHVPFSFSPLFLSHFRATTSLDWGPMGSMGAGPKRSRDPRVWQAKRENVN